MADLKFFSHQKLSYRSGSSVFVKLQITGLYKS